MIISSDIEKVANKIQHPFIYNKNSQHTMTREELLVPHKQHR